MGFSATMARPISSLTLTEAQRKQLRRITNSPTASVREARRCRIILLRADGLKQEDVALRAGVNRPVVVTWEQRFRSLAQGRDRALPAGQAIVAAGRDHVALDGWWNRRVRHNRCKQT